MSSGGSDVASCLNGSQNCLASCGIQHATAESVQVCIADSTCVQDAQLHAASEYKESQCRVLLAVMAGGAGTTHRVMVSGSTSQSLCLGLEQQLTPATETAEFKQPGEAAFSCIRGAQHSTNLLAA